MKEGTNKGQEQERQERNKHADYPRSLHLQKDAAGQNWISKNTMWQLTIKFYLKIISETKWITLTRTCVFFVISNFSLHTWVLGSG